MLLLSPWQEPLSCQSHSCATGFGSRRVSAISNTVLAVDWVPPVWGIGLGQATNTPLAMAANPSNRHPSGVSQPAGPVCRALTHGVSRSLPGMPDFSAAGRALMCFPGGWLAAG